MIDDNKNCTSQGNIEFNSQFQASFDLLGKQFQQKWKPTIQFYQHKLIPFQNRRISQQKSLVFQNSSLQEKKIQLLNKIEKINAQNQKNQYTMQRQSEKIHQLQRVINGLEQNNEKNLLIIVKMNETITNLQQSIRSKVETIHQIQKDKIQLSKNWQLRNNQYNILLANFMKDKNFIAEKLNSMNQLQQKLIDRQNDLKSQQFYLKKQWQLYEQQKSKIKITKQQPTKLRKNTDPTTYKSEIPSSSCYGRQSYEQNSTREILRTPLKKIFKYHQNEIYSLSLNYNGNILASCGGDRQIKIYDVLNLRNISTIQDTSVQSIFISVALDYSGERLLAGSTNRKISVYHTNSGKELHGFLGHGDKINSVAWASTKQKFISGAQDKQIKLWDLEKGSNIFSIGCQKAVKVIKTNNAQPFVYSGHSDGSVRIYSTSQQNNTPVSIIKSIINYPINSISLLSNRHQVLVSSTQGSTIYLLDLKMNKDICRYDHNNFFNSSFQADISPSQNYIVAGNCDGNLYYWNRYTKQIEKLISAHQAAITTLKYHFINGLLVTTDKEGNLILWT